MGFKYCYAVSLFNHLNKGLPLLVLCLNCCLSGAVNCLKLAVNFNSFATNESESSFVVLLTPPPVGVMQKPARELKYRYGNLNCYAKIINLAARAVCCLCLSCVAYDYTSYTFEINDNGKL